MGTIQHDAILVTFDDGNIDPETMDIYFNSQKGTVRLRDHLKALAVTCGLGRVTLVQKEPVLNGYLTMVVVPDGSKEGWEDSDKYEQARARFLDTLAVLRPKVFMTVITVSYGELGLRCQEID